MPKKKTHKGLKKRVKVTARGKIKAHTSFTGHLMSGKTAKRRRKLGKSIIIPEVYANVMKEMLNVD
ncbi:MAG: 50S ribosomal protein L35 [Planctomycetes bacterium GWF2_41_51]|nr:MAG: 50S ribosomal protein L35 [Planctomycetes bacterium GWF2_41_51]HBG27317.1 50S ribosomal protein L35 [Phycisphaerales bacterium]